MRLRTITVVTQLKRDPEADFEIEVTYEYYHGNSRDSEDPSEITIQKAIDQNGIALTDSEIEEIRSEVEYEIVVRLKADREDAQYENWKDRNL